MIHKISRFTRPNLTTIAQPLYDLGAISMRMLTKIMHKEELEEREVLLPHGLTERRSTRKREIEKIRESCRFPDFAFWRRDLTPSI